MSSETTVDDFTRRVQWNLSRVGTVNNPRMLKLLCYGKHKPALTIEIFQLLQSLNDLSANYCPMTRPKECRTNFFILFNYFIYHIISLGLCRGIDYSY